MKCSDITISSCMLSDIDRIDVTGENVITIENLTSFHTFHDERMFVIYLRGYHNRVRSEFIKKYINKTQGYSFTILGL